MLDETKGIIEKVSRMKKKIDGKSFGREIYDYD
jgi:hypothetical protein